jgi:hypothetical protein
LNVETECVLNFQRAFASVYLAPTSNGQWLVGISTSTAVSGLGYYPSVWDRTGNAAVGVVLKYIINDSIFWDHIKFLGIEAGLLTSADGNRLN